MTFDYFHRSCVVACCSALQRVTSLKYKCDVLIHVVHMAEALRIRHSTILINLLLQYVAVCCSVLQSVAVCYLGSMACDRDLQDTTFDYSYTSFIALCCIVLQCVAVWFSVLQCIAVCWFGSTVFVSCP